MSERPGMLGPVMFGSLVGEPRAGATGDGMMSGGTASEHPAVLFLLSSLATGGSELKTVRLANALASRGVATVLACLGPPFALRGEIAPEVEFVDLRRRGKLSLRALRGLIRIIRARAIGTVVAVNPYSALYMRLARPLLREVRFVATVNTTDAGSRKFALQMHLYRHVLRAADVVVFGAEAQRRAWARKYRVGTDARRTRVIYNGVDTERFAPSTSPSTSPSASSAALPPPLSTAPQDLSGVRSSGLTIGTVGQMRPEKSQIDLVRATALLRSRGFDVQTLLVGDGSERPHIEAEIARLGLGSHVILAGERRDVRPALAAMDVFVLPSTAVETFSNAVLEALSCGIPVVASDIGGIRELLAHGGGVTYPPGDVARLAEHLDHLLRDPARRVGLAAEARRAAQEHFSWSRMVEEFLSLLDAGMNLAESTRWRPRTSHRMSAS